MEAIYFGRITEPDKLPKYLFPFSYLNYVANNTTHGIKLSLKLNALIKGSIQNSHAYSIYSMY